MSRMTWTEDSAMKAKFRYPRAVFDGKLFGGARDEMNVSTKGISVWDGEYHRIGAVGATNYFFNQFFPVPGVGLFGLDVRETVAPGSALKKSRTGLSAFVPVLGVGATEDALAPQGSLGLPNLLIDCGHHTFDYAPDAHGEVERRVLLYTEYVNNIATPHTDAGKIWFSVEPDATAGDDATWHSLFDDGVVLNIRHFHGGRYIKGKGLYVFTGDSNVASSVLFCPVADIPTLINASIPVGEPAAFNPVYYDRWCLGTGDRDAWGTDEFHSDYILTGNLQKARTVEILTSDSKYGYYLPDSSPASVIRKVDFFDTTDSDAGTISEIETDVKNIGWTGVAAKNGLLYLSTRTRYETGAWSTNNTGSVDIWCIDPEDDSCKIVKSIPVALTTPANATEYSPFGAMVEYGGSIMGLMEMWSFGSFLGDTPYAGQVGYCGYVQKQKLPATNLFTNGTFQTGDLTGITFNTHFNKISITAGGTHEIVATNVIEGVTSGAKATVATAGVALSGGGWATSDAVAVVKFTAGTVDGVFVTGERIKVGAAECGTIAGIATGEVVADPTGQLGGNVLRVVIKNTALTNTDNLRFTVDTPAGAAVSLSFLPVTFACRIFIDESSVAGTTLNPWINALFTPGGYAEYRNKKQAFVKGKWHLVGVYTVHGDDSITRLEVWPDGYNETDNDYGLMYFTDFQLVKGAIPNEDIQRLPVSGGGGLDRIYR